MAQNPDFAIQLLEKIGAPLAAAVESVPLQGDNQEAEAAKLMAKMLGQTVQVSISLGGTLDLKETEQQADSTRVALAALVAPLIANFYSKNARVPEDQDLKRITKSLEAVLVFSENFSPASEEASRLTTIHHAAPLFDTTQAMLVTIQALTPVISAIAEFPFGLGETKLIQDVSDKLEKDAAEIVADGGFSGKLSELLVFKALAQIYAECHLSETNRLLGAGDEERAELSIDPVWENYETKLAMVKALTGAGNETEQPAGGNVAPDPVLEEQPAEPPPAATETPVVEPQPAPSAETPPPAQPAPSSAPPTGGPMGFFTKKEDSAPPPTAAETPPAVPPSPPPPPVAETPPAQPPAQAEDSSPPPPPPASSGGPMGFFAKKDNTDNSGA